MTTLVSGEKKPGYYNLTWLFCLGTRPGLPDNPAMSSGSPLCGVYFCTPSAESQRFSRKVYLTE